MIDRGGPRVINLRDLPKGTRANKIFLPDDVVRVDRGSPWGNPYRIGDWHPEVSFSVRMGRDHVLALYSRWLDQRLFADPLFLEPLRGKRLACWCAPEACHADIILGVLDRTAVP